MKKNTIGPQIILWTFLVVICCSWLVWGLVEKYVDSDNHENRKKAVQPMLTIDNYLTFANEYDEYFNDNMQFRNSLISLNSTIDYFIFDRSASKKVIKGSDDWLFYADTLSDYKRDNLYTNDQLETIKNDALTTKQYFDAQGIEFIIFIGPNKSSIYGEYMPKYIEVEGADSRTEQVVNYLRENTDIAIIYPKQELLAAKEEYPELTLFLKLDTHWNYMGGYFASRPLLNYLGVETTPFNQVSYEQVNEPDFFWNGYDLSKMLGLSNVLNEDNNYYLSGYSDNVVTYEGDVRNNVDDFNGAIRTHSTSNDKRKIFLARDSFGEAITPYIAAEFSEMYSVHLNALTKSQIVDEAPDVFIYEKVERSSYSGLNVENWPE